MNSVDRVLYEELTHLMDRLATSIPDGSLSAASLLEDYGRWRRALEDVENLWAVAAWRRSAAPEEAGEQAAALAA